MMVVVDNFQRLRDAIESYAKRTERDVPLILILQTPGGINYRFIITQFGIEKQDCHKTGSELYDPNR